MLLAGAWASGLLLAWGRDCLVYCYLKKPLRSRLAVFPPVSRHFPPLQEVRSTLMSLPAQVGDGSGPGG